MAGLKLPYLCTTRDQTGKRFHYFRSKETGRIRLPDDDQSPQFFTAYSEALALRDRLRAGANRTDQDSLTALIRAYLKSAEYRALADPTQIDYARTCRVLEDVLGDQPYRYITRGMIKAVRDDFADTSRKANKLQQMLSRLYSWGQEEELVPDGLNPTHGLRKLRRKGGIREYVPWSDQELEWAIAAAPLHLLTPILIVLYTGQRGADVAGAAAMTWQQDQGDMLRVRTSKTHELIDMPCHPALRAHLDQLPRLRGAIAHAATASICLNPAGKPWPSVNAMRGHLRRFVEGHERIPDNRGLHGIRYASAARMADGGASIAAIEAVLGHRTFRMAIKYASARDRAAEGIGAMASLEQSEVRTHELLLGGPRFSLSASTSP